MPERANCNGNVGCDSFSRQKTLADDAGFQSEQKQRLVLDLALRRRIFSQALATGADIHQVGKLKLTSWNEYLT